MSAEIRGDKQPFAVRKSVQRNLVCRTNDGVFPVGGYFFVRYVGREYAVGFFRFRIDGKARIARIGGDERLLANRAVRRSAQTVGRRRICGNFKVGERCVLTVVLTDGLFFHGVEKRSVTGDRLVTARFVFMAQGVVRLFVREVQRGEIVDVETALVVGERDFVVVDVHRRNQIFGDGEMVVLGHGRGCVRRNFVQPNAVVGVIDVAVGVGDDGV